MSLTFPWWIYPRTPVAGYHDLDNYKQNLIDLNQLIKKLSNQDLHNTLLHITIGAALEEEFNSTGSCSAKHFWRQLFPYHLEKYIDTYKTAKVIHIIISPNNGFNMDGFIEPCFIKQTQSKMNWLSRNNYYWSTNYNFEVYIFNTMMPTVDFRNESIIQNMINKGIDKLININNYKQSIEDNIFTNKFYVNLNTLFNKITLNKGFITCFSFAVFNKLTKNGNLNNYIMFGEIKKLFDANMKKTQKLLSEWEYIDDNYTMIPYNYEDIKISYLDDNITNPIFYHINFDKMDCKMEIKQTQLFKKLSHVSSQKLFDILQLDFKTFETYKQEKKEFVSVFKDDKELKFKIIQIDGDGDCLFSAIRKKLDLNISICELRRIVQQYLKQSSFDILLYIKNINDFKNIFHYDDQKIIDTYHDIMSYSTRNPDLGIKLKQHGLQRPAIYGGYLEILVLSKIFNISINIINQNNITKHLYPDIIPVKHIYLHYENNHYNLAELI